MSERSADGVAELFISVSARGPTMKAPLMITRDALLGVVVAAIHADGKVVRAEIVEAQLQVRGVPALDIDAEEVRARLAGVKARLASQGEQAFLDACVAALPPDLRVRAFHAVAEVIAADREVLPSEERFLAHLATSMQVAAQAASTARPRP